MRKNEYIITDDNYYDFMVDIGEDVVRKILSTIADIYSADYRPVPYPNPLAYNTMSISLFYDTKYGKLYVTYKLDEGRLEAVKVYDSEIYARVNKNIQTIQRDQDIVVGIVGEPASKPKYSRHYPYTSTNMYYPLEVNTEFFWNYIPGPENKEYPFFIGNTNTLKDNIRKNNIHPKTVQEYFDKVIEINQTYLSNMSNMQYELAFKKYISASKTYMKYIPRVVEEWRSITIYIDVRHDTHAEKLNSIDHKRGKLEYPERIRQYIIDWAREHGKYNG